MGHASEERTVLSIHDLRKSFHTPEGGELRVLDGIEMELHEGEIVALLGRSGSGKSTLLRCLSGLILPTSGTVIYQDQEVTGPMPGMAMVFQSFALFPWMTVQQNVELGLKAQGVPAGARRQRALEAIDVIGLDGFESAFPKELSGGMRQRVGFARALVTNPDILLMDEPFSALDILTAENLRAELLDLWHAQRITTRAMLLVTHNIEEAVLMADRILVLGSNPGRIRAEVAVPLPRPRDRSDPAFRELVEYIYKVMTTRLAPEGAIQPDTGHAGIGHRLLATSVAQIGGLLEHVAKGTDSGREDLPRLARAMNLEVDDLFPVVDAAALLRFAEVRDGDIELLPIGKTFAAADIQERKQLFADQVVRHVPLISHISQVLHTQPDHHASEDRFLRELEAGMSPEDASAILTTAIDWGRYSEI
ncbi:MAG: nitrate/sulfonate/bicarbonate ABC transporter ATP-binding protein, partial [Thermomicrobiales bacterium]